MSLSPLARLLSRKRLLIFDLDGTLVDSSPIHARAFQEVFAPHGIEVDYAGIAGMPTDAAVDRLASGAGIALDGPERARLVKAKRERALGLIERELVAIEGAIEFVRAAEGRFRMALCTSASRAGATASLARVGLSGSFDPVVTAEDVRHGKPNPEPFLIAIEAHRAEVMESLVFEDAESGLAAAAGAGVEAVRIGTGAGATGWGPLLAALGELAR
jgi:HAD superfamily hydrolase (TIGR01509 family)